jgi:hypothetical protein
MSHQSDPDETLRFIVIGIAAVLLLMILIIYRLNGLIYDRQSPTSARSRPAWSGLTPGWAAFRDIVFRSPTFPFRGRRTEEYGLSDRQSTDASDRAVEH